MVSFFTRRTSAALPVCRGSTVGASVWTGSCRGITLKGYRDRLAEEYMKFRPQRGGLIESMNAVVHLDPTLDSLARHLWDTFAVTVDGDIVGFTDEQAL